MNQPSRHAAEGCASILTILTILCTLAPVVLGTGCGSGGLPPDPLAFETWTGGAVGTAADDQAEANTETAGQATGTEDQTVVAGQTDQRGASRSPVLDVSVEELDFGQWAARRTFEVGNSGGGTMSYRVATEVAWATARPGSGTSTGNYDRIEVRVNRAGLTAGQYSGQLSVTTPDGQSQRIPVRMSVPASPAGPDSPRLELSTDRLDFTQGENKHNLILRNVGGGKLAYTLHADVDWVSVQPSSGELAAAAQTVEVTVDYVPLLVGRHEAHLTVETDVSSAAQVLVAVEKPLTVPLIMPWLEVNSAYPGWLNPNTVDEAVRSLWIWRRVADTAIVSTTAGHAYLYTDLRQRLPGMTIIPGLKTSVRLTDVGAHFDYPDGWRLIGADIAEVVATSGQSRVVLENEVAVYPYLRGEYEIDLDRMRQCLSYLPKDVEIIWHPGVIGVNEDPESVERSVRLCKLVNQVLVCRFTSCCLASPGSATYWAEIQNLQIVLSFATHPILPIAYFGCFPDNCYWNCDQVGQLMQLAADAEYEDLIFYPNDSAAVAEQVSTYLWQDGGVR
jgi:hypothetical protein